MNINGTSLREQIPHNNKPLIHKLKVFVIGPNIAILLFEAAIAATPEPGKVIFEVEQNRIGKSSLPVFLHSSIMFKRWSGVSFKS